MWPRERRRLERLATTGDRRTIPGLEEWPSAIPKAARGRTALPGLPGYGHMIPGSYPLALLANNARFLILPKIDCPNLASRVLALCTARLSADWQAAWAHPILAVGSFVDSQRFRGTSYKARG